MTIAAFRTNQDLDERRLREAFGHFPSGVVAVAALVGDEPVGLAASSFTSVSLDPPLVSFSVANTSRTWPALRAADRLGVTVLAAHHGEACRQLAGPVEHRFDDLDWSVRPSGAVVLDDGLAQFDCAVHREVEAGDHTIVLLALHEVAEHALGEPDAPLLFHRSRLGPIAG